LSGVYSLAVHGQGLWLLSGLESGGINLQTVRHDEGKRIHCLRQHTSTVSVLKLAQDERSVLSGSWDKTIIDWDLNTGQVKRSFGSSSSQISAIEMRPFSSLPVPETADEKITANGTMSADEAPRPLQALSNGLLPNGNESEHRANGKIQVNGASVPSPADSLDALFDEGNAEAYDDDEFSRAIANGIQQQEDEDAQGDITMTGTDESTATLRTSATSQGRPAHPDPLGQASGAPGDDRPVLANGVPHADDLEKPPATGARESSEHVTYVVDSTFLSASIDGALRIWDKRVQSSIATITPRNSPPWCMGACWSPDGNFIYAGRRNGTVEEYSLHKGVRGAERTFRFPNGSGPVSALRAMPNGRHLIW
jgi:transcriptional activator SPT8